MIEKLSDITSRDVSRETVDQLEIYTSLLRNASNTQNLVSSSTLIDLWHRHILDSAQLLRHADEVGTWIDIGSGAGLPGIVLAIVSPAPITLVEPRRLRVDFLQSVLDRLTLPNVTLVHGKASAIQAKFDKITARAVAPTTKLFELLHHLSRPDTVWVLPKGRTAQKELDEARATWQGEFRLEASRTDPSASILLARGVRRRAR